jgi:hypothetical protein
MQGLGRFARSPWAHKRLVLEACSVLTLVSLSLHVLGLRGTLVWIDTARMRQLPSAKHGHDGVDPHVIARVTAAVARRCPWQPRCLATALTILRMLRRRRQSAELVLGARRTADGGIAAHAWVEQRGCALAQPADIAVRYPVLRPANR